MNLYEYQRSRSFIDFGPSSLRFNIFKFIFLRNCMTNWSQFLCGTSIGWGNASLIKWSSSHDQDAAMPIYGKNSKKSSSLEPNGIWPWKLVCCIGNSSAIKFIQMMTLVWPWPNSWQGQIWSMLLHGEKGKMVDFFRSIVVCDIKVGGCSQLNEYMNLYEYQRSRSFIDLCPNHSDSIFLNFISSITVDFNISSALRWAIQDQWSYGPLVEYIFPQIWQRFAHNSQYYV